MSGFMRPSPSLKIYKQQDDVTIAYNSLFIENIWCILPFPSASPQSAVSSLREVWLHATSPSPGAWQWEDDQTQIAYTVCP